MEYTVKELAELAGVSSRTLRYYDQIGLLKPLAINESGYRIYGEEQVDLLQQILFYREMDVRLNDIKEIMYNTAFDEITALKQHDEKLKQKRNRLDNVIQTVEKTIANKEGGRSMKDEEKFAGLRDKLVEENERKYGKEIREKYGEKLVNASNKKMKGMSEKEFQEMQSLGEEIMELLKEAYKTNDPTSPKSRELVMKHKEWLMYSWPTYSKKAHAGLAEMYVADERFTMYYDKAVVGGARFLRDAIIHNLA